MAEMRIVYFQSKKVKRCKFFFISNNYYISLKRYFENFVTNDCFSVLWRTAALKDMHTADLLYEAFLIKSHYNPVMVDSHAQTTS